MVKKCGVIVEEFSIGWDHLFLRKRKDETLYSLRLLPIGGYRKMYGEDEDDIKEMGEGKLKTYSPFKRISFLRQEPE